MKYIWYSPQKSKYPLYIRFWFFGGKFHDLSNACISDLPTIIVAIPFKIVYNSMIHLLNLIATNN